jgi:hypothetical protein
MVNLNFDPDPAVSFSRVACLSPAQRARCRAAPARGLCRGGSSCWSRWSHLCRGGAGGLTGAARAGGRVRHGRCHRDRSGTCAGLDAPSETTESFIRLRTSPSPSDRATARYPPWARCRRPLPARGGSSRPRGVCARSPSALSSPESTSTRHAPCAHSSTAHAPCAHAPRHVAPLVAVPQGALPEDLGSNDGA